MHSVNDTNAKQAIPLCLLCSRAAASAQALEDGEITVLVVATTAIHSFHKARYGISIFCWSKLGQRSYAKESIPEIHLFLAHQLVSASFAYFMLPKKPERKILLVVKL